MATPGPGQIAEDLQDLVRGEVLVDDVTRALYSTDASIFQVMPLAVVVPRDEVDVQAVVKYAAESGLPLAARGAGSGMAGESLTPGIALDFSRYFCAVTDVGGETVRVQPGVVYRQLNDLLAPRGRRFAPDPASGVQCTVGGMVANNASGARALRHGYTRDHLVSLRVVLDNGEAVELGCEPPAAPSFPAGNGSAPHGGERKAAIVAALRTLLQDQAALIEACQPKTRFNRCGYLLSGVLTPRGLDLPRLIAGSEGTLALVTEATLRTVPLPEDRAVVLLAFTGVESAARAVPAVLATGPSACDLLDRRLLTLACNADPAYERIVPAAAQAVLLVEYEADSPGAAVGAAKDLVRLFEATPGRIAALRAPGQADLDWLWRLRELALPRLHALRGRSQAVPYVEDVGVPVEQLAVFLRRMQDLLQKHQTTGSFLVHAGAGQVHTRPFLDLSQPEQVRTLQALAEETYRLTLDLGGTISTQHGVGLARSPWVAQQYGRLYQVFREVKAIFDPRGLFNPGKIVDGDATAVPERLRKEVTAAPPGGWQLRWPSDGVGGQCQSCNGCGTCRTEEPGRRMCPLFRVERTEAATPRAKANVLRAVLGGTLPPEHLTSDDLRGVADLCVNCRMCAVECPAGVNVPKLMLEAKAQHVSAHGIAWGDWVLSRAENFAALGSAFAQLVNWGLRSRTVRWVLERTLGLSRHRRLQPFARRTFLALARRRGWTRPPAPSGRPRVAYFVDVYANYNDPSLGEAAVAVLRHNGVDVYVPPRQVGCGMAPLAHGDVDTARRMAEINLRTFGDLARAGYAIVCSEPTAALMLRQDYPDLVDDPDARLVAERSVELTSFLWDMHRQGRLRTDLATLDLGVGHHVPCHVKALGQGVHGPELLGLIPGLRPRTIDVSCSGMAGTFGLKAENFATSLAAGRPMLTELRRPELLFGSSECSPCRLQMEQGSGKRSLHPVQYLALAYGLLPELADRLRPLRRPGEKGHKVSSS